MTANVDIATETVEDIWPSVDWDMTLSTVWTLTNHVWAYQTWADLMDCKIGRHIWIELVHCLIIRSKESKSEAMNDFRADLFGNQIVLKMYLLTHSLHEA